MLTAYGFARPYNFTRAIPFLISLMFLVMVLGSAAVMVLTGELHWGTYRFAYFVYAGTLALGAATLSFVPRLAWCMIILCLIELSFGLVSSWLARSGLMNQTLLPENLRIISSQYQFHPLLQGRPTPNFRLVFPDGTLQHNSQGLRGAERIPTTLSRSVVVATLGGSSTYDIALLEGKTWPEALERKLGTKYAVLNYGVPGYSTAEHIIQTIFYLNAYGLKPHCALYYVGWNDIRSAHIPTLDPAYADFHLLSQSGNLLVRSPVVARISPVARITVRLFQSWADGLPLPKGYSGHIPNNKSDERLENIFRSNLNTIATINRSRGIETIFVGQILNRAKLRDERTSVWFPLVRNSDVWPLQARFNTILAETAESTGVAHANLPIEDFEDGDFIDNGHFSAKGSEKFATLLAEIVQTRCAQD